MLDCESSAVAVGSTSVSLDFEVTCIGVGSGVWEHWLDSKDALIAKDM